MRYIVLILVGAVAGFSTSCESGRRKEDDENLKQVLLAYFDGIKNRDTKKMAEVTTDDFIAYEEGKIYNNDSVFRDMKELPYITANFRFDNFRVDVDGAMGSMSYDENAVFILSDTSRYDLNFLGSASFKKIDNTWKMNFLHTTRRMYPKKK
jgi:hypothetical protein